jgi:hypothetical protein
MSARWAHILPRPHILLPSFWQLNIFLAILVEGYMAVKHDTERASGVPEDLAGLLAHEALRLASVGRGATTSFVSDEALCAAIQARLHKRARAEGEAVREAGGGKATLPAEKALEHYEDIARSNAAAVPLPGGLLLGPPELAATLEALGLGSTAGAVRRSGGGKVAAGEDVLEAGQQGGEGETTAGEKAQTRYYLDPAVQGLMARYAVSVDAVEEARAKEVESLASLETMANVARLALRAAAIDATALANGGSDAVAIAAKKRSTSGHGGEGWSKVRVRIERARGIPRMDLFKGADAFCTVLVEGLSDVFQTPNVKGSPAGPGAGIEWVWGNRPPFEWKLPPPHAGEEEDRRVVVLVYDNDQFSSTDVIGCAVVPLADLASKGPMDKWIPVERPRGAPGLPEIRIHVEVVADDAIESVTSGSAGAHPSEVLSFDSDSDAKMRLVGRLEEQSAQNSPPVHEDEILCTAPPFDWHSSSL